MDYFKKAQNLFKKRNLQGAKKNFELVIKENPSHFDSLYYLGIIYCMLGFFEKALIYLDKAIDLNPDNLKILYNKAVALQELKHLVDAIKIYDNIIHKDPSYVWAHYKKANALQLLEKFEDSIICYKKVIHFKPDFSEVYYNQGISLYNLKKYKESYDSFSEAIKLQNNFPQAYYNRSLVLADLHEYKEAINDLDKAIELNSNYDLAFSFKAEILEILKEHESAIEHYKKSFEINPNGQLVLGSLLHAKFKACDWDNFGFYINEYKKKINLKILSSAPFPSLSLTKDPYIQLKTAKLYVDKKYKEKKILGKIFLKSKKKIRIGYFSPDFNEHPVSYLMERVFEYHDRKKFEVYAFSLIKKNESNLRKKLINVFDEFIDVEKKTDYEIAKLARELEIDIAVDLAGHTANNRFKIFSFRVAPVQIAFLGYLGTTGANYIDYIIADKIIIPKNFQKFYSESILYINSYQPNDALRSFPKKRFENRDLNLPDDAFVYCCLNNNYKITPNIFYSWMKILNQVKNSVIFLSSSNKLVEINLKKEAAYRGVNPSRIIFSKRLSREDYLALYHNCNLFLDTDTYNAGVTASDALWMGLPVLTIQGKTFSSRMCSSLLNSVGLNELITNTYDSYELKAINLANDENYLKELREKLERNKFSTLLFDTNTFVKNLENGYVQIFNKYIGGFKPEHIEIS